MRVVSSAAAVVVLLATTSLASAQAPPDKDTLASQRYDAATQAFQQQHYVEAALYFEAADAARPSAVALFTAGLAWDSAGRPDRAADDFQRAIATGGLQPQDQARAQERLKVLEPVLGRIEVSAPDGWIVQLDSNGEASTPAILHGAPGMHVLHARAPNRDVQSHEVVLTMGHSDKLALSDVPPKTDDKSPQQPQTIVMKPTEPAPQPVVVQQAPSGPDTRKTIGLVVMGAGIATLAAGAILGFQALDARDAYNARPTQASFDHADALQGWTNIAFIAGGIFTVGGAALAFWPFGPKKTETTGITIAPTLGGASLRGSF